MPIRIPTSQEQSLGPLGAPAVPRVDTSGLRQTAEQQRQVTDAFTQAQERMQQQRDNTMVLTAVSEFSDLERAESAKWRERRGVAAAGLQQDAAAWWDNKPGEVLAKLETPEQRDMFQREIAKRREGSLDSLAVFEAAEGQKAQREATAAYIDLQIEDGGEFARENILGAVAEQVRADNGGQLPSELFAAAGLEALTKLHSQNLDQLIDIDPVAAETYFNDNIAEIDRGLHEQIRKKLDASNELFGAQTAVDELWAKGLRKTELFDAVREKYTGDKTKAAERERALSIARQQQNELEEVTAETVRTKVNAAWDKYLNSNLGLSALSAQDVANMREHDPDGYHKMLQNPGAKFDATYTAPASYRSAEILIETASAEELATVNMQRLYSTTIAQDDLRHLDAMRVARLESIAGGKPVSTLTQKKSAAHSILGYSSSDDEQGTFDRDLDARIRKARADKGGELTDEEEQVVVDRAIFDASARKARRAGIDFAADVAPPAVVGVPAAAPVRPPSGFKGTRRDFDTTVRELKAGGYVVTDESVTAAYEQLKAAGAL